MPTNPGQTNLFHFYIIIEDLPIIIDLAFTDRPQILLLILGELQQIN